MLRLVDVVGRKVSQISSFGFGALCIWCKKEHPFGYHVHNKEKMFSVPVNNNVQFSSLYFFYHFTKICRNMQNMHISLVLRKQSKDLRRRFFRKSLCWMVACNCNLFLLLIPIVLQFSRFFLIPFILFHAYSFSMSKLLIFSAQKICCYLEEHMLDMNTWEGFVSNEMSCFTSA